MTNLTQAIVKDGVISTENIGFYNEKGYLIAPLLIDDADINALKVETAKIFRGERGIIDGLQPVAENERDDEILSKYVAIHFPHKISPLIKDTLSHPKIVNVLTHILGPNVKSMQSMLFVKAPGKAGQSWHQDEYYIPTRDCSLVGAWIAIDDATIANGCLWIIPGSHKPSYIRRRVANDNPDYADVDTVDVSAYRKEDKTPVEVKRGTVVFFNGYTLHSSLKNRTDNCFRMALVNHYMRAESMLPWDQDGKLKPTTDLRDIVVVAGNDPYHYKGVVDINKPYLRPEVLNIKTGI